jgi:hypothetical protein
MEHLKKLRAKYRTLQIRVLSEGLETCKSLEPEESLQFLQALDTLSKTLAMVISDLDNVKELEQVY